MRESTIVISVDRGVIQNVYIKGHKPHLRIIVADFDYLRSGDKLCVEVPLEDFSAANKLIREDKIFEGRP